MEGEISDSDVVEGSGVWLGWRGTEVDGAVIGEVAFDGAFKLIGEDWWF